MLLSVPLKYSMAAILIVANWERRFHLATA
jgi:hypothetical protein